MVDSGRTKSYSLAKAGTKNRWSSNNIHYNVILTLTDDLVLYVNIKTNDIPSTAGVVFKLCCNDFEMEFDFGNMRPGRVKERHIEVSREEADDIIECRMHSYLELSNFKVAQRHRRDGGFGDVSD